jgi:hypothetical protein
MPGLFLDDEQLTGFVVEVEPGGEYWVPGLPSMLTLAARVGCVEVLAELVDNRLCALK